MFCVILHVVCRNLYSQQLHTYIFSTDPPVGNWLMMQSYGPTLCVVSTFLIVATVGPIIVANRKPVNVQLPMLAYNFGLVLLSLYMLYEVCG